MSLDEVGEGFALKWLDSIFSDDDDRRTTTTTVPRTADEGQARCLVCVCVEQTSSLENNSPQGKTKKNGARLEGANERECVEFIERKTETESQRVKRKEERGGW